MDAAPEKSSLTVAERKAAAQARLDRLKAERLTIVQQVAAWKWIRQKPIEDPARESAVLDSVEKQANDLGLDPGPARNFFSALMADARNVQHALHKTWRRDGPPPEMREPDLEELRRGIDRLTPQLLEAWAETRRD